MLLGLAVCLGSVKNQMEFSGGIPTRVIKLSVHQMVSRTFIQGIYEFLTDFFLLCFLGGSIFDCNQKIQKSHYFILAKS